MQNLIISRPPEATMTTVVYPSTKGYWTLRLPLDRHEYTDFSSENAFAKARLEELSGHYPELFPQEFEHGYVLYGYTPASTKLDVHCRRLRLEEGKVVYTVAPSFGMPYRSGEVEDVSNALFLMRLNVPCGAMAQVFGRHAMFWDRLDQGLGRFSVGGTTGKSPAQLPHDLVADEKHRWRKGERVSVATTASEGCLLGASVVPSASQPDVKKAYGVFANEALDVDVFRNAPSKQPRKHSPWRNANIDLSRMKSHQSIVGGNGP
jgi:hypothetical protein